MCIYINWAAPTIDILFVCGLPSDKYQLGRSDDLYIICLWTTLRCIYINWAAPTIAIFHLDYPPIINILDYPPNHFL